MFGTGRAGAGVADNATAFWEVGVGRREEEESAALQESSSGDVLDEEQLRINQ